MEAKNVNWENSGNVTMWLSGTGTLPLPSHFGCRNIGRRMDQGGSTHVENAHTFECSL